MSLPDGAEYWWDVKGHNREHKQTGYTCFGCHMYFKFTIRPAKHVVEANAQGKQRSHIYCTPCADERAKETP